MNCFDKNTSNAKKNGIQLRQRQTSNSIAEIQARYGDQVRKIDSAISKTTRRSSPNSESNNAITSSSKTSSLLICALCLAPNLTSR
jgi:hypothetical protein